MAVSSLVDAASLGLAIQSVLGVGAGRVAFGRSRSGSLWVLTGLSPAGRAAVCRLLTSQGFEVCRVGASVESRLEWLGFRGPAALESVVVPSLAEVFPLAPGSRSHRLLGAA